MKNTKNTEFNPAPKDKWHNNCYLIRRVIGEAIQKHAHHLSGRILDYGCGSMPYKSLFKATEYVGVDIEISGHPDDKKTADVYFDGINLPFEEGSFDGVLASEVLEHVFTIDACLKEIFRVLKPGGRVLATCPFVWPLHEQPYDFARYTPHALKHLVEQVGFKIVLSERRGTPIETIGQLLIVEIVPRVINGLPGPGRLRAQLGVFLTGSIAGACRWFAGFKSFVNSQESSNLYLSNVIVLEKPKNL